jgi:hypothetical protein
MKPQFMLTLKVVSGEIFVNTEEFTKMDPFVVVSYNGNKY